MQPFFMDEFLSAAVLMALRKLSVEFLQNHITLKKGEQVREIKRTEGCLRAGGRLRQSQSLFDGQPLFQSHIPRIKMQNPFSRRLEIASLHFVGAAFNPRASR
jgi:hypothetical protein